MKKFISFLMAFMLCMAFMIPTFAEDEPEEISANNLYYVSGNRIISEKGEYELDSFWVGEGSTLIIGKDVKIKMVGGAFGNRGKIEVLGTLDLSQCSIVNRLGDITVSDGGTYITKAEKKIFGNPGDGSSYDNYSGSTISEGNGWIVAGIGAVVVIAVAAVVIAKKKKKIAE